MVRLAWLMGGNREEAEDIVHDAFLQLEPRWSSIENPPAYLRQTVVNGVRARHHQKDLERRHASYEGDVSSALDDYEEIWASVEALPDRQRQALVLRFYLDLTIAEVADLLDCPIGTAKSLIHQGDWPPYERRCSNDFGHDPRGSSCTHDDDEGGVGAK